MRPRSRDMPDRTARAGASLARLSVLLLLVFCETRADPVKSEPISSTESAELHDLTAGARVPRSASHRFLQLISGDNDDDERLLRSFLRSERSDGVRLVSLPVVLLDVELPERRESTYKPNRRKLIDDYEEDAETTWPVRRGDRRPAYIQDDRSSDEEYLEFKFKKRLQKPVVRDPSVPSYFQSAEPRFPNIVSSVASAQLVEKFRAQAPTEIGTPAIIQSEFDASERTILPDDEDDGELDEPKEAATAVQKTRLTLPNTKTGREDITPSRPTFTKPIKLRAVLTVPRAGYSESYTAWWDPNKGDSRIHFQGGSTVTFRKFLPNGLVEKVEMHVDRTGKRAVRCGVAAAIASAADRAHPALPDMQLFTFSGYESTENGRAERWEHSVSAPGDAKGETLTTRHELLLTRDVDFVSPVRYRVSVHSTVLGPDCDGYEHYYIDARTHKREPKFFEPNIDEFCDEVEQLNGYSADDVARLEPLREFTMSERDPRYAVALERFMRKYERQYANDVEGAVRKNLLTQSSRVISSGNRAGATFQLGLNPFADRLDVELAAMTGVARAAERVRAEKFPHAGPAVTAREERLPDHFDWRVLGGVSKVQFQGTTCASCWAFAVAGAVEGALFRRTQRLVPLSAQNLVDCAGPFGARGCNATWPSFAYNYVQHRGLSALDEYVPYTAKVGQCKADSAPPVTRISAHVNVTKYSVPALQVAIKEHGPAVVIVDSLAKSFVFYKKGVLYDDKCSKKSSRHAVLAVGWGQKKGEPHFILKNSWSAAWGEAGFVRVQARANTCGVLTHPSYPRLEDDDVLLNKQ